MNTRARTRLLFFAAVLSLGSPLLPSRASAASDPSPDGTVLSNVTTKNRVKQLWSDNPEYAKAYADSHFTIRPKPISQVPPELPPGLLPPNTKALVEVAFLVDETGKVIATRILTSADPRLDTLAKDAVAKWTYQPAEDNGKPVKSFLIIPIDFDGGPPPDQLAIHVNFDLPRYGVRGTSLDVRGVVTGPGAIHVKAARVIVSHVLDDTGGDLKRTNPRSFYAPSVGSTSDEDNIRTSLPSLSIDLNVPSSGAKALRVIEGTAELVIPRQDPKATARLYRITSRLGAKVESVELREAGVTLVVFDKPTAAEARNRPPGDGGPQDFDEGPLFGKLPPEFPAAATKNVGELTDNDLAIGISDPEGRLIGLEFQTFSGEPVRYNHNGWYHSGDSPGKRTAVYRMADKPTDDLQLVCFLITPKSLVRVPFRLENVPLPPAPSSQPTRVQSTPAAPTEKP